MCPAHAWIIFSPYVTHHLPEVYAEPERFRPERWEGGAPPPYAYIPFGAGAHACIGAMFRHADDAADPGDDPPALQPAGRTGRTDRPAGPPHDDAKIWHADDRQAA